MCRPLLPIYNALWVYHLLQVEIQVWPNRVPPKPFKWPPVLEGNFCFVNLALLLAPSSVSGLISCVCVLSHSNHIGTLCSMYLPLPQRFCWSLSPSLPFPHSLIKGLAQFSSRNSVPGAAEALTPRILPDQGRTGHLEWSCFLSFILFSHWTKTSREQRLSPPPCSVFSVNRTSWNSVNAGR